eukprot:3775946-Amphidinium_carterae.2
MLQALGDAVTRDLGNGSRTIVAPVGSHASVGAVERYHAELLGAIRAMKMQHEQWLAKRIPLSCPLYAWLIRHVAWILPRYGLH